MKKQWFGRTKHYLVLCCLGALIAGILSTPGLAANPVSVAIMPFTEGQLTNWGWSWDLAEGITNLVIDETVKRGKLSIVERNRIDEMIGEQDLAASGRIEAETASQIGKLLGARLMVLGTITKFDFKQSAGLGFSFLRVSGAQAEVALTGRIVDSQNGRVLASFEGTGSKTGASFSIDNFKGLSLDGEQFQGSTLGQATYAAIAKFVDNMTKEAERIAAEVGEQEAQLAQTGEILALIGADQFVINLGSKNGIKLNAKMNISRMQTVKGLKAPVKIPIGTAKVISVEDEAAVLVIESKTQPVQEGDVVAFQ